MTNKNESAVVIYPQKTKLDRVLFKLASPSHCRSKSDRFRELSEAVGVANSALWNWDKGRAIPRANVFKLKKILDFLGVSFQEFHDAILEKHESPSS
mgnify:CR=1 FL=1